MVINGPETRKCPHEFQDRLTKCFGKNQFGDPNFIVVWGQSQFIRMGNVWRDKRGNERLEYRDRYQCHAMPCWVIMRWKPPSAYGSPAAYYMNTYMPVRDRTESSENPFDSIEGFYVTAEYPWRGRYEIVVPLMSKEFKNGRLEVEHFPLSHMIIDLVIPLIIAFQELSLEERDAARKFARAAEEKKRTEEIAERMLDAMPVWMNPVSYSAQGCHTSLIDRKMQQIQKTWDRLSKAGSRPVFNRGLALAERPMVAGYKS